MTPNDVMALIKDKGIPVIDLRFIDLPGLWQHFTVSAKEFDLDATTLADVLDLREQRSKSKNGELRVLYDAFMSVVQKAAHAVDQLEG